MPAILHPKCGSTLLLFCGWKVIFKGDNRNEPAARINPRPCGTWQLPVVTSRTRMRTRRKRCLGRERCWKAGGAGGGGGEGVRLLGVVWLFARFKFALVGTVLRNRDLLCFPVPKWLRVPEPRRQHARAPAARGPARPAWP